MDLSLTGCEWKKWFRLLDQVDFSSDTEKDAKCTVCTRRGSFVPSREQVALFPSAARTILSSEPDRCEFIQLPRTTSCAPCPLSSGLAYRILSQSQYAHCLSLPPALTASTPERHVSFRSRFCAHLLASRCSLFRVDALSREMANQSIVAVHVRSSQTSRSCLVFASHRQWTGPMIYLCGVH